MAIFEAALLRRWCLEEGADDAGFVETTREALGEEREDIHHAFPRGKTIISICCRLNPENMQAPPRHFANDETHHTVDVIKEVSRKILARLNAAGIRGVVSPVSFPMDLQRWPGRMWDISHKPVAVQAGLGHMGIHRNVIHPKFGNFILLNSILIDAEMDEYGKPLADNPCVNCNLCVSVCPVGAVRADGPFDSSACLTHNYREFLGGFQDWVETVVESGDVTEYRRRFRDTDTLSWWQSLSHGANYKSSYCMAVCPAGDEVFPRYAANKPAFVEEILKPLKDMPEPVYVLPNTAAEKAAQRNPKKEIRHVRNPVRISKVRRFFIGLRRVPPQRLANVELKMNFSFYGSEEFAASIVIEDSSIQVSFEHLEDADGHLRADAATYVKLLNGEARLILAILLRRIRYQGDLGTLRRFLRLR